MWPALRQVLQTPTRIFSQGTNVVVAVPLSGKASLALSGFQQNLLLSPALRSISTTPFLLAEPLKKKKRIDPAVIKAREERKRRKLEKSIRRLQKHEKQLKPIYENEVPVEIVENNREHFRPPPKLSAEEEESRWLLEKKWSRYRFGVHVREIRMIDRLLCSQRKALQELRAESEELYQAAIQMDFGYIPSEIRGPVETPPIPEYEPDEGDYFDLSKKWD